MKSLILLQNVDFPHDIGSRERQGEGCGAAEAREEVPRARRLAGVAQGRGKARGTPPSEIE